MKYRTTLTAKAEVLEPKSDEFKAIASSLKDRYGFDLKPQMDLLYVRSCLVSAGPTAGTNENDDIFTREEAWAARHTPVLKPFNWQHNDKDILGVIYTVQARDLNGNILDINSPAVPDRDFDLWVEAAVFSLIQPERASEIARRSKSNSLYVSMEAWFNDYSYGFCDKATGQLSEVVTRNKFSAFLDEHLRANKGTGVYRHPEKDDDVRIGRVLRSITFGGCGFVDRPANKRSVIEAVEPMNSLAEQPTESQIALLLQQLTELQGNDHLEEIFMNTSAQLKGEGVPEVIASAVETVLDKREKVAAAEREHAALVARATQAENQSVELGQKLNELNTAQENKKTELDALRGQLDEYSSLVDQLVNDHVTAGATDDTPPEIAKIDAAKTGEEAFKAKIAWIQNSMASLRSRAARASELEAQLAEAESVVREQDVRSLLGEVISEEALETFVAHASSLSQAEYTHWRDEKELMVLELTRGAKKELPPAMQNAMDEKKAKKAKDQKPADKGCANVFEALLAKRRSESGTANPDTMNGNPNEPDLINPTNTGETNVKSGVNPGQLRTPRYKIAGETAGNDPAKMLENAQAKGGVQLAGSQVGDEGETVNPFRVLASTVLAGRGEKEEKAPASKPGFDPVL